MSPRSSAHADGIPKDGCSAVSGSRRTVEGRQRVDGRALAAAERPVVVADFAARPPYGWDHVIAIAAGWSSTCSPTAT